MDASLLQPEANFDQEIGAGEQTCWCHPYTGQQRQDFCPQSCQLHIQELTTMMKTWSELIYYLKNISWSKKGTSRWGGFFFFNKHDVLNEIYLGKIRSKCRNLKNIKKKPNNVTPFRDAYRNTNRNIEPLCGNFLMDIIYFIPMKILITRSTLLIYFSKCVCVILAKKCM